MKFIPLVGQVRNGHDFPGVTLVNARRVILAALSSLFSNILRGKNFSNPLAILMFYHTIIFQYFSPATRIYAILPHHYITTLLYNLSKRGTMVSIHCHCSAAVYLKYTMAN